MTCILGRDYFYWSSVKSELMSVRYSVQFSSSGVSDSAIIWTTACQGFPVHHQFPELSQTHVHQVGEPSNHLIFCCPLLVPSVFPSIKVFSSESVLLIRCQNIGVSASASVLPMNIQDWFPLGLTGWISLQSKGVSLQSKALSRVFSNNTVQKHQFLDAQPSL